MLVFSVVKVVKKPDGNLELKRRYAFNLHYLGELFASLQTYKTYDEAFIAAADLYSHLSGKLGDELFNYIEDDDDEPISEKD